MIGETHVQESRRRFDQASLLGRSVLVSVVEPGTTVVTI